MMISSQKAGFKGAGCSHPGICGEPAEPFGEAGYPGYGQHRGKTECGSTALRQRSREKKSQVQQQHDGRKPFEERRGLRQAAGNVGNLYHRE